MNIEIDKSDIFLCIWSVFEELKDTDQFTSKFRMREIKVHPEF